MKTLWSKSIALILITSLVTGCASKALLEEEMHFPAEANQPFLTLEKVLRGGSTEHDGLFPRVKTMLFGARTVDMLMRPVALALDGDGRFYVADADAGKVLVFQMQGDRYDHIASFGGQELQAPAGIVVWNDEILVSDGVAGTICRFSKTYEYLDVLEVRDVRRPGQLKVNPVNNELFIVDTPNHHVVSINTEGQVTGKLVHKRTGDQLLGSPMAVDFSADGHIIVLDGLSRRVEVFNSDYTYETGFGGYDRVPGSFSNPKGLAISSDGYIFISDAAFGNVQIFDQNGALLYFFGEIGKAKGEFLLPGSLTFDAKDQLYIMDQFNSRVQIFRYRAQGE
ncbi:MAG: hypothetical protein K9M49_08140 [Candidatus Marinimicrobia bacterium]|nr:hypothetical protein [Candidatus Neomarinimicrobiota bacterium]MCF7850853.1 hypothetical protein [Candidatus Neomarinimicrobiota bacterium]MCF7905108.1 hypothetical protein [Candidatus Neomarinimicrobiota bacterium]